MIICFKGYNFWNSKLLKFRDVHLVKQLVDTVERSSVSYRTKGRDGRAEPDSKLRRQVNCLVLQACSTELWASQAHGWRLEPIQFNLAGQKLCDCPCMRSLGNGLSQSHNIALCWCLFYFKNITTESSCYMCRWKKTYCTTPDLFFHFPPANLVF